MNWDDMGFKDWSHQNWDGFRKDWKSGTGFISDQLKSANGWIDQNLRSFERGWKKFWGKSDPETRKLSLPQFSDFQASNGWQNQGFQSSTANNVEGFGKGVMNGLTDSMISMNPISNVIEQIGNLFKPGFELIPRASISASQQNAALAGGLGFAIIEPGPAGEARLLKNVAKNGMIIKQTSSKVDYLFKNRNDAMNWARNQLGHNTTKIFDSRGKWIGWGSEKGKVYWSHNDWITGMGSSKFPHLNYNIGVKGHLFLEDKINNVGLWETFLNYFR